MLTLESVVRHYRGAAEEVRAVDGVSLELAKGEMLVLQGPSGSGKSTLLMLIGALLRPERGAIRFLGRDVGSFSEKEAAHYLMHELGFIYQRFHLMRRVSALDNAARKVLLTGTGMRDARNQAKPWLQRVGLSDRLAHTPEMLSGGERQRVAIARVLAAEPKLILADEPTANLDTTGSAEIVNLLRAIAHERGASVLLVTHDSAATSLADRCLVLRDGRLSSGRGTARDDEAPTDLSGLD